MAELNARDRLQPSLLDRLIDLDPHNGAESIDARALTRQQLRAAVLRDLAWLFNATRPQPEPRFGRSAELALWDEVNHARESVINFGMPAFGGSTLSTRDTGVIERSVAQAIRLFEPRIDPDSLEVELKIDVDNHHNTMQLVIRGQMWSQPVPLELLLSADIDVETGNTRLNDMRS